METKVRADRSGWIIVVALAVLGLFVRIVFSTFRFTGYILMGCAAVLGCYLLLRRLANKRPKLARRLMVILSLGLGIGFVAAIITGVIIVRSWSPPLVDCDYVVVLGAGVNGTRPSLSLQERIDAAYDYLVAYPNAVCIVSGGQGNGENITEAQCMYNELTAMGIETDRIWLEQRATNTRDNIRFSLDIIEEETGTRPDRIGLVSSEYHLYRAGLFARSENVIANGIPAKTSWVTLRINYFLREIVAVWYYTLLGG